MAKREKAKDREVPVTEIERVHDFIATCMAGYPNPDKSNIGKLLHEIFIWQEAASFAKKAEEAAWRAAQLGEDAPLEGDDEMRLMSGIGTHVVTDSARYSAVVRIDNPRASFDRDTFIAMVSRKFDIPAAKLMALADMAKKDSKLPLSKSVIAVEKKGRR